MVARSSTQRLDPKYTKLIITDSDIPYLGDRPSVRVDDIYYLDYRGSKLTPKAVAGGRSLPLKTIEQAIEWCENNEDILDRIKQAEWQRVGLEY